MEQCVEGDQGSGVDSGLCELLAEEEEGGHVPEVDWDGVVGAGED